MIISCFICDNCHTTLYKCKAGYVCEEHKDTQILMKKFTRKEKRLMKKKRTQSKIKQHDKPNTTLLSSS